MNPDLKLLLDEMDKRFSVQERRFDTIERKLDTSSAASASRLDALESATKGFDEWRPSIEGVVDDLKLEVHKLATLKLEVGKITKYWESHSGVPSLGTSCVSSSTCRPRRQRHGLLSFAYTRREVERRRPNWAGQL
jgi:hypothetical protein